MDSQQAKLHFEFGVWINCILLGFATIKLGKDILEVLDVSKPSYGLRSSNDGSHLPILLMMDKSLDRQASLRLIKKQLSSLTSDGGFMINAVARQRKQCE